MNSLGAIVGVLVILLAVADLVTHWKTRKRREPFAYQDWQAEERRQRIASFKAPADGHGARRLRRRSS